MAIRIALNLTKRDLGYFRDAVKRARAAVRDAEEEDIVDAISAVIADIKNKGPLPDFIAGRLPDLESLIRMLSDEDWRLPRRERNRLLATFVYFVDPEDLIPDDIPGIGYLDDVIMIELLMREMRHVSDAYGDFCRFRTTLRRSAQNADDAAARDRRLARRRLDLQERMRRRQQADRERGRISPLF